MKLGLERIERLLSALGSPHHRVPCVLIAGTNGKGSTAALLAAIAHASGKRTGLYTSPHLEDVEERLRIDGAAIDRGHLGDLLGEVVDAAAAGGFSPPTYFEALTAAAFLYFARAGVELSVLEVGLGGRLDATNVSSPALSVITAIGFDHEENLGNTLTLIAGEKAGIARAGRPLLTYTVGEPEVRMALEVAARERGAELVDCAAEVRLEASPPSSSEPRQRLRLVTPNHRYEIVTQMLGAHQRPNVVLAVRAAETLSDLGLLDLGIADVERGIERCRWPGRLESIPLEGGRTVLLDGAHNLQGAESLAAYLDAVGGDFDLLYGALAGKRAESMLPLLAQRVCEITLTEPPSPRALGAATVAGFLAGRQPPPRMVPEVAMALDCALHEAALPDRALLDSPRHLLVCGSLYLVGEVRRRLRENFGRPEAAVSLSTG